MSLRRWQVLLPAVILLSLSAAGPRQKALQPLDPLPEFLSQTGLYADPLNHRIAAGNMAYSPLYPLWSDGAGKKRWIRLPEGSRIAGVQADDWIFPVGTTIWKEFSFGRRVETRLLEKTGEKQWRYASYAWNEEESDALLAPERGLRDHFPIAPGVRHDIPGVIDCRACHEGQGRDIVLGFNALQLSPERDPLAPNAEPADSAMWTLPRLIAEKRIARLSGRYAQSSPVIDASTPRERAALGYLSANCGGCHNPGNPQASAGMFVKYVLDNKTGMIRFARDTFIDHKSIYQIPGLAAGESYRILPGDPARSALVYRMGSRNPYRQMPPLGTKRVDAHALELISHWIQADLIRTTTP